MGLNWRKARWIAIIAIAITALALLGITDSLLGIGLDQTFVGLPFKTILALVNAFVVIMIYKVL